jgi:hypothetical protein
MAKAKENPDTPPAPTILRPLASPALEETMKEFAALEDEIATLSEALSEKKARAKYLGENVMVEQVAEIDGALLDGIRLSDGSEWTFERDIKCGIPTARRQEAYNWLAAKKADAMLKREIVISFGKDSAVHVANFRRQFATILPQYEIGIKIGKAPETLVAAVEEILTKAGLLPGVKLEERLTHDGSTLSSFVTKQIKGGHNVPECFGVYAPLRAYPAPVEAKE